MKSKYSSCMSEISPDRESEYDFLKKEIYPIQNISTE